MYIKQERFVLNNMYNYRIIRKNRGFNNWRERLFDAVREGRTLFFIKLDTTGFDPENDAIIGISIVKSECVKGQYVLTDTYDSLIFTHKKLSKKVSELTDIKQEQINTAPDKESVIKDVREFLGKDAYVAGFNTAFIGSFLQDWNLSISATFDLNVISRALLAGKSGYKYLAVEFDTQSPIKIFNTLYDMIPRGVKPITKKMVSDISKVGIGYAGFIGDCNIKIKKDTDKFGDYLNIEYDNKDLFEDYSPESLCSVL